MNKLINISQLTKILNFDSSLSKKPRTHILRYWEKEFKIIKPKKINKRRYYSTKQVEIIKMIKFLLKTKGMTIEGVKRILDSNINKLDDHYSYSLRTDYYKLFLKTKSKSLKEKIDRIRKYGKKNSS